MDMPNNHAGTGARENGGHKREKGDAAKREAVLRGELMANRKAKPPAKAVIGAVVALVACIVVIVAAVLVAKSMNA